MLHVLPKIAWEHIKLNGAFVCHSAMRPMPIWSISFLLDWCPKYTNSTQYTARPGENNLISLMHRFLQAAAVHVCCKPQKLILFIGKAKKIESEPKSGFSTFLFIDFSKPHFITKVKAISLNLVCITTNSCSLNIDQLLGYMYQLHGYLVPVKTIYFFSIEYWCSLLLQFKALRTI